MSWRFTLFGIAMLALGIFSGAYLLLLLTSIAESFKSVLVSDPSESLSGLLTAVFTGLAVTIASIQAWLFVRTLRDTSLNAQAAKTTAEIALRQLNAERPLLIVRITGPNVADVIESNQFELAVTVTNSGRRTAIIEDCIAGLGEDSRAAIPIPGKDLPEFSESLIPYLPSPQSVATDASFSFVLKLIDDEITYGGVAVTRKGKCYLWIYLGSGLIDHSQKMTVTAMQIADMKVWAHRS